MAVKPQKDPRYKLVQKTPRRYRDVLTGELLNRSQFEQRTKEQPTVASGPTTPRPEPRLQKPLASQEIPGEPRHSGAVDSAVDYLTPIADVPEPPPMISMANAAAQAGVDVTQAAAQKTSDSLANLIGDTVAMIGNLVLDVKVSMERRYLVIDTPTLEKVTRPASRLAMRHLPFEWNKEIVSPDAQDAAEMAQGVALCVAAVWANKQVFDAEMRRREEEYAQLFDAHYGPGSYQRARAQAAGQSASTNGPIPGTAQTPANGGQGVISNSAVHAAAAGPYANGNGNHHGDGGRTAALIHQLYQKYPGNLGGPVGF